MNRVAYRRLNAGDWITKIKTPYLIRKYIGVGVMRDVSLFSSFLSIEPLLEDLGEIDFTFINWVIVGGESGKNARPMKKEWVLNIKRQCKEQGVPFFFKQWGTYGEDGVKRSKKVNGCLIDGVEYKARP